MAKKASPKATQKSARKSAPGMGDNVKVERPEASTKAGAFGSDAAADTLRALEIPYIALNPGASYRGLHDSLINYLGNVEPQMLLCLHEGHAVGIAHGYAKITGKAIAVGLHSNVGLMHGSMGIFNAWCDRAPMLIMGATGSVDAVKRRPWIEWIHTSRDQGALVRNFVKWDDQPSSPEASREAILRAYWIANTLPKGPVYINLDVEMQESPQPAPLPPIDYSRYTPDVPQTAPAESIAKAVKMLKASKNLVILAGRGSRGEQAWANRIALAEALGATVVTDLKTAAAFPTDHPAHIGEENTKPAIAAVDGADTILSLDWIDLSGTIRHSSGGAWPATKIIQVSCDYQNFNGWTMDYQAHAPADVFLAGDPDVIVADLLAALKAKPKAAYKKAAFTPFKPSPGEIEVPSLFHALRTALGDRPATLAHIHGAGSTDHWPHRHPLDYVGGMAGAGLGGSCAAAVGTALALRDMGSDRITIDVTGDGDFSMGMTALWTAVHYKIPLLIVIQNNTSFFNDELHQQRMAVQRTRNVKNRWIGMRVAEPDLDFVRIAEGQGAVGFGPVTKEADLVETFKKAIASVNEGNVVVVDVRTKTV